jgi:Fe2+ or Zn2+ uptake regulation protein
MSTADPSIAETSDEAVAALFARHGLRCTRQRKVLYQVLAATDTHPTADELHQQAARETDGFSLATVYNTLEAFCDAGLAQKLPSAGGPARYDAAVHDHLHVRDRRSGQVLDAPSDLSTRLLENLPPETLRELEQRLGFKLRQVQIEVVGEYDPESL